MITSDGGPAWPGRAGVSQAESIGAERPATLDRRRLASALARVPTTRIGPGRTQSQADSLRVTDEAVGPDLREVAGAAITPSKRPGEADLDRLGEPSRRSTATTSSSGLPGVMAIWSALSVRAKSARGGPMVSR